jgi:hypothetical protein
MKTGHWFVDQKRTVALDEFDYVYKLKSPLLRGHFIELDDGSIWQIEEQSPDTKAFYTSHPQITRYNEDIVTLWQAGERLIFHKVVDRESLLIYNLDRDLLFDVAPFLPPSSEDTYLAIAEMDFIKRLLTLTDGTVWNFDALCKCNNWKTGDPIVVAKNTPWRADHTHILINLYPCECGSTVAHIHPNRLGVKRFYLKEE